MDGEFVLVTVLILVLGCILVGVPFVLGCVVENFAVDDFIF